MLPEEAVLALFPRPPVRLRIGPWRTVALRPATLADAAAMEAAGCSLLDLDEMTDAQAIIAAWVLSLPRGELERVARGDLRGLKAFSRRAARRLGRVVSIVKTLAREALLPFVPPKDEGGGFACADGLPDGYGWPLEVAEALCAHYGWPTERAMATPVQTAVALLSVGRARGGGAAGGPDYFGRIRLARLRAAGIIGKAEDNG